MLDEFDNTWGIIRESDVPSVFLISTSSASTSTYIYFLLFPAQVYLDITDE